MYLIVTLYTYVIIVLSINICYVKVVTFVSIVKREENT